MVDTSFKLQYMRLFNAYPIVDKKAMPNLTMERAKMVLVASIMERTHGVPAQMFLAKMCEVRGLSINSMPTLYEAARHTGVRLDFINDYGKIQYLFERNPVMNDLPNFLMSI